jgi:Fe-S-cluster formation regulator IscX/YfhJ
MAKATKVQTCDDGCDHEHDNKSESESDNDDEPTKSELIDMLEDAKEHFDIKRRECKDLHKKIKALKQAFDELNASHERLEEAHEKLGKAHEKLEKAHSTLLNEQNEKKHVVTCDKGLTYDIIDESFYKPIIVAFTNPSCSTSTSTSSSSDGFTCDASLMVENKTLKKEVKELNHTFAKAYDGENRLGISLQRSPSTEEARTPAGITI